MLTAEKLREVLDYDAATGVFRISFRLGRAVRRGQLCMGPMSISN
jgi:hypothetical protein